MINMNGVLLIANMCHPTVELFIILFLILYKSNIYFSKKNNKKLFF